MSNVWARYDTVAAGFSRRLEGMSSERWTARSPCEDWTARDVVEHVVTVHRRVLSRVDGTEPNAPDGEDLSSAWRDARSRVQAALADPTKANRIVAGRVGDMSFEQLVGTLLCADTLIHTWDLACATGQDDRLDPAAVDAALRFLASIGDALRVPGGFGPPIEPPADADAQTRLLCVAGRRV